MLADGPLGSGKWRCECGKWQGTVPKVGAWGRTSMRARMAQVLMAHGMHVRHVPKG